MHISGPAVLWNGEKYLHVNAQKMILYLKQLVAGVKRRRQAEK
jgi:hypothetical protein